MVEVVDVLSKGCSILFFLAGLYVASLQAYHIRMYAIHTCASPPSPLDESFWMRVRLAPPRGLV
jgi:hypothetical protein|tara:strand:- start:367 stop:558 length:192 start_codon:yes stop_codon:yes gene_type:complete